jgi:hypothetical protein
MKSVHRPKAIFLVTFAVGSIAMAMTGAGVVAQSASQQQGMGHMPEGLMMPAMNAADGRSLFASKGYVMCHSINGIGGEDAPSLDAATMSLPMNPFDFAARMWRGAPAMIAMQQDEMGGQIEFTGAKLADIIAFVHDPAEQSKFSVQDIPPDMAERLKAMAEMEAN